MVVGGVSIAEWGLLGSTRREPPEHAREQSERRGKYIKYKRSWSSRPRPPEQKFIFIWTAAFNGPTSAGKGQNCGFFLIRTTKPHHYKTSQSPSEEDTVGKGARQQINEFKRNWIARKPLLTPELTINLTVRLFLHPFVRSFDKKWKIRVNCDS